MTSRPHTFNNIVKIRRVDNIIERVRSAFRKLLWKSSTNCSKLIVFPIILQVMIEYFKELEEESIRDNFVVIYELLDELLDFGYPQTTDSKILQEYITQEGHKLEIQPRIPMAVTNAVSWRSEGIKYRKNEVFLDVIESVNILVRINYIIIE